MFLRRFIIVTLVDVMPKAVGELMPKIQFIIVISYYRNFKTLPYNYRTIHAGYERHYTNDSMRCIYRKPFLIDFSY